MQQRALISNFSFTKYNYQNIHSAAPEVHFDNPCIGYVKKGHAKFLYKGQTLYAHEGDLIYIACYTKYHSVWIGNPDIEFYAIDFDFKNHSTLSEYQFQIIKNYPSDLLSKIYESYQDLYFLSVSYFYQLLDDIYKKLKSLPKPIPYTTIEPAVEYIENNFNQNITINFLAALCRCSESSFFKLFKKATGVTPIAYKNNIMIQNALNLLANTTLSIEEISIKTGFSSSNYFRTVFFKHTGKTPKELR